MANKMADLKFGPEWLRALSDGGSLTSPPPSPAGFTTKFKLAEHRYGREEFLALFQPGKQIPEVLMQCPSIVVEKAQQPMSFISISEDEQRLLSQSVNSGAVFRSMGRGGPAVRGGRGGAPDRGRGRGRGREGYYPRGPYDEEGGGFGRTRLHNRSESWEDGREPKWFEKDRTVGDGDYSGRRFDEPPSPRKDFSRSMSSDNWREARKADEEEDESGDWRRAGSKDRWSRSSWSRDPREAASGRRYYDEYDDRGGFHYSFDRRYSSSRNRTTSGSYEDDQDDLPEWSLADADEDVGTFDASGAFLSMKDMQLLEEEEVVVKGKEETPEKDDSSIITYGAEEEKQQKTPEDSKVNSQLDKEKPEDSDQESNQSGFSPVVTSSRSQYTDINQRNDSELVKNSSLNNKNDNKSHDPPGMDRHSSIHANNIMASEAIRDNLSEEVKRNQYAPEMLQQEINKLNITAESMNRLPDVDANFDHLEQAAENLMDTWTAEEEEKSITKAKVESGSVPMDHKEAKKWFYMDPQGELQGPFTSSEMAEWFSAGYFTMNLLVKRGCDERFHPLGELIKRWGRVPFLPGPVPPPLLNNPNPSSLSESNQQEQLKQEQIKLLQQQQQFLIQQQLIQQQAMVRQIQMQQIIQQLQQQEMFTKLPAQQQQALVLQILMKQQQQQQMLQMQQQKVAPRSPPTSDTETIHRSMSQPSDLHQQGNFQRSMSSTNIDEESASWRGGNPPVSVAWSQSSSVWDIEPPVPANSMAEIQRLEQEKARKEKEAEIIAHKVREEEELRKLEELQRQEDIRRQEEHRRQQEEMSRREVERQRQLKAQEEARRREEEERKRQEAEEEMKRKESLLRQQRELLERQQQRDTELEQQAQEELRRRQVSDHTDSQRKQELQRQQQQQEALRRLQIQQQQAQLAQMQLPSTAQWGNTSTGNLTQSTTTMSLAQIQHLQEEKERMEREEKDRMSMLQRQQMQVIQSQQKSWAAQTTSQPQAAKSLKEIQEEQARQDKLRQQQQIQQQQQQQPRNLPIGAAAVWGGGGAAGIHTSGWATEGAWAPQNKPGMGFWDDAIASNNKTRQQSISNFPTLGAAVNNTTTQNMAVKMKNYKAKKEEEAVQRLFQAAMKPTDEFTQWCEQALRGMHTSVDVPTFIAFLQDVESPYEVHDYVKSYLGETQQARDFAREFVDKRSAFRSMNKQGQQENDIVGPAKANPGDLTMAEMQKIAKNKKKKQKMQKIDNAAVLGFSVHADTSRKNIGEIEAVEN